MLILGLITNLFAAEHQMISKWLNTPDVIYCKDSNVSLEDVTSAIDYWKNKGFKVGNIIVKEKCSSTPVYGKIKISKINEEVDAVNTYGHTRMEWTHGSLDFTVVMITREGGSIYEVVVHEMGHALGIDHSSNVNSIMYHNHVGAYTKM